MKGIRRILVPTDFGEVGARALVHALGLAECLGAEVHLLHVTADPVAASPTARDRERLRQIWQKMDRLPPPGEHQNLAITRQVVHGSPPDGIVRYAREHNSDLIVMGTRGRSGLAHLVMGSVAERVIRQAPCPVLAVQPAGDRPRLAAAATALRTQLGREVPGNLNESRGRMTLVIAESMGLDQQDAEAVLEELVTEKVVTPALPNAAHANGPEGPRWLIEPGKLGQATAETSEEVGPALDLIHRALEAGATDLHIAPDGPQSYLVQFRIDGRLARYCPLHSDVAGPLLRQYRLMANFDFAEPFRPHEGRLHLPDSMKGVEARITSMPVAGGDAVAIRFQLIEHLIQPLDYLGLDGGSRSSVEHILSHGAGLVLVTGPTGSGKTTTVYSLLKLLDNGQRQLVSIEDPIEYPVPFIRQMEVAPVHDITMTTGLRTLLRMDPDVVFVGEIRDVEAAEIAMRAASSGRFVLSTLHTRDVASTVTALRDLHIDNRSLAGNLAGIISQRLVRRLCPDCRIEEPPDEVMSRAFEMEGLEAPARLGRPVGCPLCRGTGYRGRIGVFESIVANRPAVELIQRGAPEDELRQLFRSAGTPSLLAHALEHARNGITSLQEAQEILWA